MATAPGDKHWLPKLEREWYRGQAAVFWTFTVEKRGTGWLTPEFHQRFREMLLHAAARESLICPVYCLMPDHLHFLCLGLSAESDQRNAVAFIRTYLAPTPFHWQHQPHDHVLREKERERGALQATASYILQNPERANLLEDWKGWPYLGALVPGYPKLHPADNDYWERFWKIDHLLRTKKTRP